MIDKQTSFTFVNTSIPKSSSVGYLQSFLQFFQKFYSIILLSALTSAVLFHSTKLETPLFLVCLLIAFDTFFVALVCA